LLADSTSGAWFLNTLSNHRREQPFWQRLCLHISRQPITDTWNLLNDQLILLKLLHVFIEKRQTARIAIQWLFYNPAPLVHVNASLLTLASDSFLDSVTFGHT